jgi:hypothetical protein
MQTRYSYPKDIENFHYYHISHLQSITTFPAKFLGAANFMALGVLFQEVAITIISPNDAASAKVPDDAYLPLHHDC